MNKAQQLYLKAVEAANRLQTSADSDLEQDLPVLARQLGVARADYPQFKDMFGESRARLAGLADTKTVSETAAVEKK